MAGMFAVLGLASAGVAVVLSSAVFAGIRRTTGLTFRRCARWPPVDVETAERWLRWYDERLEQITAKADERVQWAIARYGNDIQSPTIRQVWEQQLRQDAQGKVSRLRERRRYCADLLTHAQGAAADPEGARNRHPVGLALYLGMGEKVVDKLIGWMRSSNHFCLESHSPYSGLADDLFVPDSGSQSPPAAYIASPAPRRLPVEPSAPTLTDEMIHDMSLQPESHSAAADPRGKLPQLGPMEPPPYTPIDDPSTEVASGTRALAIAEDFAGASTSKPGVL